MFKKLRSIMGSLGNSELQQAMDTEVSGIGPFSIDAALRDCFAPILRQHGFKGSGRHFRRVSGDVFQAVNVQGSMLGGMFAVNMGVHPLAIADFFGEPIDVKKSKEIDCEFRRRLSVSQGDSWWSYEDSRESMINAAKSAAAVFVTHGLPQLDALAEPDGPIFTMQPDQFDSVGANPMLGFGNTKPRMAVMLARLRKAQGKIGESKEFARIGLAGPDGQARWHGYAELVALAEQ